MFVVQVLRSVKRSHHLIEASEDQHVLLRAVEARNEKMKGKSYSSLNRFSISVITLVTESTSFIHQ